MNWRLIPSPAIRLIASILAVMLFVGGNLSTLAQETDEPAPQFGMLPVGAEGSHFRLTMDPGETRQIEIEVNNSGEIEGDATFYLADTYTMTNGGMGVRLPDEPKSGPTLWIDYDTHAMHLDAGATQIEMLTVTVPEDAEPGQYLASAAIQGAASDDPTTTGQAVSFNTVSRHAMAILITLPGPVVPGMEIESAAHKAGRVTSIIEFELANSGNVMLKTVGEFTLTNDSGDQIASLPIQMGTFYADTTTLLTVPVGTQLDPGSYVATLWLEDEANDIRVESGPLTVEVVETQMPIPAQQPETDEDPATQPVIEAQIVGIPTWMLLIAIPLAILAGAALAFLALKRRMQQSILAAGPAQPQVVVQQSTTPDREPVNVRQMMPPSRNNDSTDTEK